MRSQKNGKFEVLTSDTGDDIYLTPFSYSMLSGVHRFDIGKRIQENWEKLGLISIPDGDENKWLIPLSVVGDWLRKDNPKLLSKITYMQSLKDYILSQVS